MTDTKRKCQECGRTFATDTGVPFGKGGVAGRYTEGDDPGQPFAFCDRCLAGEGPASPTCRVYAPRRSPSERRKAKYDAQATAQRAAIHVVPKDPPELA